MAEFAVNPQRRDPYKNFRFRVMWDGKYVPAVSQVSTLQRTTEVVLHRDGGEPNLSRRTPGMTVFAPVVLSRGRTQDGAFEDWANLVWSYGAAQDIALKDFRKNVTIEFDNEAGQPALKYIVYRCWPSEYIALPQLDANAETVALETLVLQHEGWARDPGLAEPAEV